MIRISKVNDVYIRIQCEPDVAMELDQYFTFKVPNAKFTPLYRNRMWDGTIHLFSLRTRQLYSGLRLHVELFARERKYEIEYVNPSDFLDNEFSLVEAKELAGNYIARQDISARDYQLEAFAHAIRTKRALLLSPTASGKSLMIYLICRYILEEHDKILVIVPTTSLVHQMATDFGDYLQADPNHFVHRILSGAEKQTDYPIVVSTWQSIYKMPKLWFDQFDAVIGDEAHTFKAKSLTEIMCKLTNCQYKFGFTGTLDGTETNKLVLEGLFGPVKKITTTAALMESGALSDMKIKAIVLNYSDDNRKLVKDMAYADEVSWLVNNTYRNKFLTNLISSLKKNTLLLFKYKDHGKILFDMIQQASPERKVYYVDGDVGAEIREETRKEIEDLQDGIIVASLGTFSTGINIKNLHNVIFASPSKSRIKVLQSIGRGLRKAHSKNMFTLYDIADDLSWKSKKNFTILHFVERVKMYNDEKFDYKLYNVELRS